MEIPLPHSHRVQLLQQGTHAILRSDPRPPLVGGAPLEFGGSEEWWSPEHLLVAAASLCFAATFHAIAARGGLIVDAFESEARGIVDRVGNGLAFRAIELRVSVRVAAGQSDLAQRLLGSAKRHCIVANSLKAPVDLAASVQEAATLTA